MNNIKLSIESIERFHRDGFVSISNDYFCTIKKEIEESLKELALSLIKNNPTYCHFYPSLGTMCLADILIFCIDKESDQDEKITPVFYDFFPQSFALLKLLCDNVLIDILNQLGVESPSPSTIPVTRIDRPKSTHFLTPMHQDYWYTLNSTNSVTVWFPIYECIKSMGYLIVVPESHTLGIVPFRKYENYEPFTTIESFDERGKEVKIDTNEILIFNQKLLHKSGSNDDIIPRLTVQLRYNDIQQLKKQTPTFKPIHSDYVTSKQAELLSLWKKKR
jgi:hypothetical protein